MKEEFKWRTMKTGNVKGNPRLKHWANDYLVFWPKRGCWPSKQKQCDWKKPVTEKPFAWRSQEWIKCDIQQTKPGLLRTEAGGRQSWDRSLDGLTVKLTADTLRLQMNHVCTKKEFWYRKRVPQLVDGEISWRKCVAADGKGICRNSWRKWMRCPRRLRVPSLNKIAQTARDRPPFVGISRSELFPGFNRYTTEWKSPPYGCRLGPIGWNTNTRRSVAKGA